MSSLDPEGYARAIGDALRDTYLNGVVGGLESYDVSPCELGTLMGFVYASGQGGPRWTFDAWVAAVESWIALRAPVEKGAKIKPAGATASKAYPNWLSPAELEAWKFARERAGLRIDGIEDSARGRLRSIVADTIALSLPRDELRRRLTERLATTFDGIAKDWERIAVTELAQAFNEGVVVAARASGEKLFEVATESDACPKCKTQYHDHGGQPRVFSVEELLPVLPPLHPRCRCVPRPHRP